MRFLCRWRKTDTQKRNEALIYTNTPYAIRSLMNTIILNCSIWRSILANAPTQVALVWGVGNGEKKCVMFFVNNPMLHWPKCWVDTLFSILDYFGSVCLVPFFLFLTLCMYSFRFENHLKLKLNCLFAQQAASATVAQQQSCPFCWFRCGLSSPNYCLFDI